MTKKVHFMGVGGSGISGVARLASNFGFEVTGCDLEPSSAYTDNISRGHSPDHVQKVDLVVVSPAVLYRDPNNPEVVEAKKRKILMTWQEFAGRYLHKNKKVICIAGTHGKSTITAMAGKLLEDAGLDPTVIIGANVPGWNGNCRFGHGEYFITEADEFYDNFLNYNPEIIVLSNIEFDHPDYFKSEIQVFDSFAKFINKLVGKRTLIINGNDKGIKHLISGSDPDQGPTPRRVGPLKDGVRLKVSGEHNKKNAAMVYELGRVLGIDEKIIKESLSSFTGIARRMELIKSSSGIELYDDYAHHPTAIKVTLEALRENHPSARIWSVVEPHGYSRTKALLENYRGVFDSVDRVIIGPIYKARDTEDMGMNAELVSKRSGHKKAIAVEDFADIKNILKKEIKSGDVIIVMGAGKSYIWAKEISGLF